MDAQETNPYFPLFEFLRFDQEAFLLIFTFF